MVQLKVFDVDNLAGQHVRCPCFQPAKDTGVLATTVAPALKISFQLFNSKTSSFWHGFLIEVIISHALQICSTGILSGLLRALPRLMPSNYALPL